MWYVVIILFVARPCNSPQKISVHMQGVQQLLDSGTRRRCQWESQKPLLCLINRQGMQIRENLRQRIDASQSLTNQFCSCDLFPSAPAPPPHTHTQNHISIASNRRLTSSLKLSQAAASALRPSQSWLLGSTAMPLTTAMMSGKLAFSWRGPGPLYDPDPLFTLPHEGECQCGQTTQLQNACNESATKYRPSAGRTLIPGLTGHPSSRIQSEKMSMTEKVHCTKHTMLLCLHALKVP